MSSPEQPADDANQDDSSEQGIPPTAPAYSTPPPEGLPSADDKDGTE
ncbi:MULTISPECIES: hypothetical protein [unclassified Mycobacterium]|nr:MULTISPECIES: hypothetical protein [unclassified Mycobacterium]